MIRGQSQSSFPKKGSLQKVLFDTVRPPSRKKSNTQFQSTKLEREKIKDKYGSIATSSQEGKGNNSKKRSSTTHIKNSGSLKTSVAVKYEVVPNILRKIERNCHILRNLHKNEQKRMSSKENVQGVLNGIKKMQYPSVKINNQSVKIDQVPAKIEPKRSICPSQKNIVELYKAYKQHFDAQPNIKGFISSNGECKKISDSHQNNTSSNQGFSASMSGQSGVDELARSKDSTGNKQNEKKTQLTNISQYRKNRKQISIGAPAKPDFKRPKIETNVFIEEENQEQQVKQLDHPEMINLPSKAEANIDDAEDNNRTKFQYSRFYVQPIPPFHARQQIEIDAEDSLFDCEIPKMEMDILQSEGLFVIDL